MTFRRACHSTGGKGWEFQGEGRQGEEESRRRRGRPSERGEGGPGRLVRMREGGIAREKKEWGKLRKRGEEWRAERRRGEGSV